MSGEEFDEAEVGVFFEGGFEEGAGVDVGTLLKFRIVQAFGEAEPEGGDFAGPVPG